MQLTTNPYHTDSVQWKPLERIEFEASIGLLIQAGVRHANHESTNELREISNNVSIYHATMSLQGFKDLLRFLRFDDQEHRNKSSRLSPIQLLLHRFVQTTPSILHTVGKRDC